VAEHSRTIRKEINDLKDVISAPNYN